MKQTLLIVDDDADTVDVLRIFFQRQGYTVLSATRGEDALRLLDNHVVHVHLLDIMMPGMDGLELCRKIKQKAPVSIPLVMSGALGVLSARELREAGFEDFIHKPLDMELLETIVAQSFERFTRWRHTRLRGVPVEPVDPPDRPDSK